MSWDGYITNLTSKDADGSQVIEHAAIWGREPLSVWATSEGFNIKEEELRQLLGDRQELFVKGVRVAGEKCVLIKDELDLEGSDIMNLRTQKNSEGNLFFLSIGKTTKTFVIVKGSATAQGGQVADKLFKTVQYLKTVKF
ncbi:profilin-1 [Takifugu flavidus]|uniref:Profilin n=1 Tax=Takifugu flavidus TaxID=433684 RepID=A0A5C6N8H3_9TELE|nr:profilin-1 [Takifugu flavidus]TWW63209.1 hypothetical protein D4764_03G0002170 [Takifugu flavidus]